MTSVIEPNNMLPAGGDMDEDVTDAATTMDRGGGGGRDKVDDELTGSAKRNWEGGKRSKRRRFQRNRTASSSSDNCLSVGGNIQPNQQHIPSVENSSSNRTKSRQNEQPRSKVPRLSASTERRGTVASKIQTSGNCVRHQTQLQSRNTLKPQAPSNTTSFLMSDLEKRQHEEDDQHQQQQYMDATTDVARMQRGQKMLAKKVGPTHAGEITTTMSVSDNGHPSGMMEDDTTDIEEQMDADFEECLFTTAIERIERLSREEVNRELLHADRNNRILKQRMASLREGYKQMQEENRKLRSLLKRSDVTSL